MTPARIPSPGTFDATRRVLLLHGIWNARLWLSPLARKLRAAGFEPQIWGYDSVLGGPARAVPALIDALRDGPPTHVVGHSLGGLVALEALQRAPDLPVARVVCLGSPLRGSGTARALGAHRWSSPILGRSAALLCDGLPAWEGSAQVGMVAGHVPRGVGRLLAAVDAQLRATRKVRQLPTEQLSQLGTRLAGRRGVIVAGVGAPSTAALARLADALAWPVLAEPRSGARAEHERFVRHADGNFSFRIYR